MGDLVINGDRCNYARNAGAGLTKTERSVVIVDAVGHYSAHLDGGACQLFVK